MIDISANLNLATIEIPTPSDEFLQQLNDVVEKIKIAPDLTITYPGYESSQVSPAYRQRLQQMSDPERDRYLSQKLQKYLYALFMGRLPQLAREKSSSTDLTQPMVNSGDRWYETEFYHQLVKANHGSGYCDYGWLVVEQRSERWQVTKDGLNIFINPQFHLGDPLAKIQTGQTISIKMLPNTIDRGVYIAVGDADLLRNRQSKFPGDIWQLYFNVDSETALALLDSLSKQLNSLKIPFEFRLAYCDRDYQYLDAVILEFMSQNWQQLQPLILTLYQQYLSGFKTKKPFFCYGLESGLGIAKKTYLTTDKVDSYLGFKYCKIIADTIIKRSKKSYISVQASIDYILDGFNRGADNL